MLSKYKLNQLYFKDTQFANLMTRRIFNVLLIANPYDAFMLEDDGRIDEKIFNEYTSLSLRYPPRFSQVSTEEEALTQLENMSFDLVICMPSTGDNDSFDIGRHIKEKYEHIPIVILTPFSHGITKRIINEDLSAFEYVFCWLGNTDLLVSIIKLMEDKMNLEHDVQEVGVQMILLVEDGIRFYSSILPNLYKFVLKQSQEFSTEALNAHQRTLRMRGRPKIVLARTYQEAMEIYRKYQNNILGVITDVRFPKVERGEKDGLAGIKLCAAIRKNDPFVPLIIQSSESENSSYAAKYGASFIDKNSKKMDVDLRRIVSDNFGFGDFVFRNPETGEEIARVRNLKELQNILFAVPAESFLYHISRNHFEAGNQLTEASAAKVNKDNWTGIRNNTGHSLDELKRDTPVEVDAVTTHTAQKAYELVLKYAGCSLKRDDIDTRIVEETRTGTAQFIGKNEHNGLGDAPCPNGPCEHCDKGIIHWKSQNYPKGGLIDSQKDLKPSGAGSDWSAWPTLKSLPQITDSDNDGMPDEWETANGLNPNKYDANGRNLSTAYDNIEVYINSLVETITNTQNKK